MCWGQLLGSISLAKGEVDMTKFENLIGKSANRRAFLKTGITAAGAATIGAGLSGSGRSAFGEDQNRDRDDITKGDIAILRFLNVIEQIETDLWIQYSELGGTQDKEVSGANGEILSTPPHSPFSMATWPSTFTTTPTMKSATWPS
ncbi:hypothetical protein RBB78_23210 [Tunturiibacter empetritectus]|uniref:hypothetical protein n=1 Tax=Tunturiibacter empetritectus TaxID=3069691 RepID=UPI003D9BE3FC